MKDNAMLEADISDLREEVAALRGDIKGLVEAWQTASGLAKFVKWVASIATAVGVIWVMMKGGVA
jgi:hypothetical protein